MERKEAACVDRLEIFSIRTDDMCLTVRGVGLGCSPGSGQCAVDCVQPFALSSGGRELGSRDGRTFALGLKPGKYQLVLEAAEAGSAGVGLGERPELTRGEYLRLLSTARVLEKERLYLLVKVFGSTGLSVGELPRLTAEALDGRGPSPVRLPPPLAEELRGYAARQGITAGPVFRSRNGQPMRRTQVTGEIRSLCRDARVPEEKGNPRCLRRLWQKTQDAIRISVDQLVVQAFDQMMEAEQFSVGWDAGKGVGMM